MISETISSKFQSARNIFVHQMIHKDTFFWNRVSWYQKLSIQNVNHGRKNSFSKKINKLHFLCPSNRQGVMTKKFALYFFFIPIRYDSKTDDQVIWVPFYGFPLRKFAVLKSFETTPLELPLKSSGSPKYEDTKSF